MNGKRLTLPTSMVTGIVSLADAHSRTAHQITSVVPTSRLTTTTQDREALRCAMTLRILTRCAESIIDEKPAEASKNTSQLSQTKDVVTDILVIAG